MKRCVQRNNVCIRKYFFGFPAAAQLFSLGNVYSHNFVQFFSVFFSIVTHKISYIRAPMKGISCMRDSTYRTLHTIQIEFDRQTNRLSAW